ncbi:hypothetical protein [Paenibacillus thiaminolyticus]|uniref:hypothetical protein n=1 Tax=Paenibacillus thiaminolyticus TaxID=49283 RepID=UPI002542C149|nr:hypothetical protein [Paenibacillus thiaminolyticus]WII34997.1 hypothetical protein O0V01_14790 [Paenibacillus thiaminolyticus]
MNTHNPLFPEAFKLFWFDAAKNIHQSKSGSELWKERSQSEIMSLITFLSTYTMKEKKALDRAPKKANNENDKQTIPTTFFVFCSLFFLDIKINPEISRTIATMILNTIKKDAVGQQLHLYKARLRKKTHPNNRTNGSSQGRENNVQDISSGLLSTINNYLII